MQPGDALLSLRVGETAIPCRVRFSDRARHRRIVVTPGGVEVVVPDGTPMEGDDGILAYIQRKRRWVFDAVREIEQKERQLPAQIYASGAKLQYRGRWLMLDVRPGEVEAVEITCRSKFQVVCPAGLDGEVRIEAIRSGFDSWLKDRAEREIRRIGHQCEVIAGVKAQGFEISDAQGRWGSCGRDGVVRVHWRLVQAPTAALEYVVAHEVAHLVHRNHSEAFWKTLGRVLPGWVERKGMLERWEGEHRTV